MKRTLVYGTATAAVALAIGSCGLVTCSRTQPILYGPEPVQETDDDDPVVTLYGVTVVDDDDEPIADLYGPKPELEDDNDYADNEDDEDEKVEYSPKPDSEENPEPITTLYGSAPVD